MNKSLTLCRLMRFSVVLVALASASGCQTGDIQDTAANDSPDGTSSDTGTDTDFDSDHLAPLCPFPVEIKKTDVLAIADEGSNVCYPSRIGWNPSSQTAACYLIMEFVYNKTEYQTAPTCPVDNHQQWENDEGDLAETTEYRDGEKQSFWVRRCEVQRLPAPINCADMADDQYSGDDETLFGWYYCENLLENSLVACTDGLDNDRDTRIDSDDPDCDGCTAESGCSSQCLYEVVLLSRVWDEAIGANSVSMECLETVSVEDANCSETDSQYPPSPVSNR